MLCSCCVLPSGVYSICYIKCQANSCLSGPTGSATSSQVCTGKGSGMPLNTPILMCCGVRLQVCSRHVSRLMCGVLSIGDIVFGHMQLTSGGGRMSCMHCMEREFQCGFVSAPRARFLGAQAISLCRAHRLFGSSSWSTHVPCDTTSIRRQGECCTALDDHPRPGSCVHSVSSPRTRQLSKMTAGSRVHVLW